MYYAMRYISLETDLVMKYFSLFAEFIKGYTSKTLKKKLEIPISISINFEIINRYLNKINCVYTWNIASRFLKDKRWYFNPKFNKEKEKLRVHI